MEIKYEKACKKINKYKYEAKKQLKNINEVTVSELKKSNEEKKKLNRRILQLEESMSDAN